MNLFNKQKKTEDQKSAEYLMKYNLNKGIEEKELGAFHERFCQFSIAREHYQNAYDSFSSALNFAKLADDEKRMERIVAYKSLAHGKLLDMQERIRSCGDEGRHL